MRVSPLLVTLTLSLTALTFGVATPAAAQASPTDYRCAELPDQARAALTSTAVTDPADLRRAQRFLATGQALCDARAEGEAARQFRSAMRLLGVDEVRAAAQTQLVQR